MLKKLNVSEHKDTNKIGVKTGFFRLIQGPLVPTEWIAEIRPNEPNGNKKLTEWK